MKNFLYSFVISFFVHGVEGMLQMQTDMHLDPFSSEAIFFVPTEVKTVIKQVSLDSFRDNSDALYLSIDDFLDNKLREKKEAEYILFVKECKDLVPYFTEYKNVFIQEIVPQFEKFATEDALCETAGLYLDLEVIEFAKYLQKRLVSLKDIR